MAKKKYEEPEAVTAENEAPSLRIHIVRKGDTLHSIAREYLGDSRYAYRIRTMNQLATDILKVGMELIIPDR